MNLSTTIKSIQDIMRKDDGVDGDAQRIGQLTWMLFLKVFDQREEEWESLKKGGKKYTSPLPEECRWRNWASSTIGVDGKKKPLIPAGEIIEFVKGVLFPELKALEINGDPMRKVIRQVFEDSNPYMKSGTLMLGVIEKLNASIHFNDFTTRHNLGNIYEQILNDLRSAGNAGEFYTPRAITNIMVELVNPRLAKRETVMDPACGTGGFLTAAISHFQSQSNENAQNNIQKLVFGIEKKQLPHLLCTTNMLLHGIDVPSQIEHGNTLARAWNDWRVDESVDCVITNPPFGGLENDEVGSDYPLELRTRETADMFLTLIIEKLLKPGGRAAIVLPDSALFGEGVKYKIKRLLTDKCNLHTIIRLPKGVFSPYTSINSNLLFFTEGKPTETIWYFEHPYPQGRKSYSKTNPILYEEFDREKDWWGNEEENFSSRTENQYAWKIDFKSKKDAAEKQANPYWQKANALNKKVAIKEKQIQKLRQSLKNEDSTNSLTERKINLIRVEIEDLRAQSRDAQSAGDRLYWPIYNLDLRNPNTLEEEIEDPEVLLSRYKLLHAEIKKTQNKLKKELNDALGYHLDHN